MTRFRIVLMIAMLVLIGLMQSNAFARTPAENFARTLDRGYCPVGVLCPSYNRGVKTVHSSPDHLRKLPRDGAPLIYRARAGDTLWGIARHFLGAGSRWRELCTFALSRPTRLYIGEYDAIC